MTNMSRSDERDDVFDFLVMVKSEARSVVGTHTVCSVFACIAVMA